MAARAYAIAIEGYDIQVKKSESDDKVQDTDSRKKIPKPSELTKYPTPSRNYVRKDYAPDEFAPAGNAFDLSLVLDG